MNDFDVLKKKIEEDMKHLADTIRDELAKVVKEKDECWLDNNHTMYQRNIGEEHAYKKIIGWLDRQKRI